MREGERGRGRERGRVREREGEIEISARCKNGVSHLSYGFYFMYFSMLSLTTLDQISHHFFSHSGT